ncbi:hypothetical protein [Candidatus Protochlamydia phocaeensis]|uniref:hypothetical protein n=1 Tax=Candidatus Protochlamydia phocaeensis TaxID=1414722 RepID=UPI0008393147|nr:hypothetical protein [Candidatus Protochlamydia phocaeensis]
MSLNTNLNQEIYLYTSTMNGHVYLYSQKLDLFDQVEKLGPVALVAISNQTIWNGDGSFMTIPLLKPYFTDSALIAKKKQELKALGKNITRLQGNLKNLKTLFDQTGSEQTYLHLEEKIQQIRQKYLEHEANYDAYLADALNYQTLVKNRINKFAR